MVVTFFSLWINEQKNRLQLSSFILSNNKRAKSLPHRKNDRSKQQTHQNIVHLGSGHLQPDVNKFQSKI